MGKKVHIYTNFCFSPFSIFDAFEIEWAEVIKWETEILVVKFTVDPGRILSSSISWKTNYLAFTISWNLEVHDFFFLLKVFSWRYRWPRLVKRHTYHPFPRSLRSLQLFPVWCHSNCGGLSLYPARCCSSFPSWKSSRNMEGRLITFSKLMEASLMFCPLEISVVLGLSWAFKSLKTSGFYKKDSCLLFSFASLTTGTPRYFFVSVSRPS